MSLGAWAETALGATRAAAGSDNFEILAAAPVYRQQFESPISATLMLAADLV